MTLQGSTSTTPDTLHNLRLAGTLVRLVRLLDHRLRQAGGAPALTLAELSVLHQIDRGVDLPSLVARALRLDPARVTQITDRLAGQSHLERTPDPLDRRCWRLHLTASGVQRLEQGRAELHATTETLLEGLSAEERAGLIVGMEGVRRVLDA